MILSTIVASLMENAERKFSQTEIYFFERWWNQQNATVRENVQQLVRDG